MSIKDSEFVVTQFQNCILTKYKSVKTNEEIVGCFKQFFVIVSIKCTQIFYTKCTSAVPASYIVHRSPAALMRSTERMNRACVSDGFVIVRCPAHFNRKESRLEISKLPHDIRREFA